MSRCNTLIEFTPRDGSPVATIPDHEVQLWTHSSEYGPDYAEIQFYGPEEELQTLTRRIGDKLSIRCSNGDEVWWGFVSGVAIPCGALLQSYSLNEPRVHNSVRVRYTPPGEDDEGNAFEPEITEPFVDDDSQNSLWKKECVVDAGEATAEQAEAKARAILKKRSRPTGRAEPRNPDGGECFAVMVARGPKYQLEDCLLYTDLGQFENDPDPAEPDEEVPDSPNELPISDLLATMQAELATGHLPCVYAIEIKADLPDINIAVTDYASFDEYLREILSLGDVNGDPLVCKMTPRGMLQICPQPTPDEACFRMDDEGQIFDSFGNCLDKACVVMACAWIKNDCGPSYTSAIVRDAGAFFVTGYEYNPVTGQCDFVQPEEEEFV